MTPMQQMFLGVGAKSKTYMDDVYSNFIYNGDGGTDRKVDSGIDINGEGGLVWVRRKGTQPGGTYVADTSRGMSNNAFFQNTNAQADIGRIKAATGSDTGFRVNNDSDVNASGSQYSSYSFRKAPGFFTSLTYTGNGSNRTISHDLGSIPGLIMVKKLNASGAWRILHRDIKAPGSNHNYANTLKMNTAAFVVSSSSWNTTYPTASVFSLGTQTETNGNGDSFVAYLFGGGESVAATARSVEFDGSNDYLQIADSGNDLSFGVDCTIEMWINPDDWSIGSGNQVKSIWSGDASNDFGHGCVNINKNVNGINVRIGNSNSSDSLMTYTGALPPLGQWTHIALVRNSNVAYLYINGTLGVSTSVPTNRLYNTGNVRIGYSADVSVSGYTQAFNGKISNVRFTKSAVYTSSFRPTYEPLTNISNTELLCCNNSSVTGSTVTPGTITASGGPPAKPDSPFDDPAGFVFGEEGNENIIKCGSYTGNGSADGPEINLGWEPQFVILRNIEALTTHWLLFDNMRGIVSGGNDNYYKLESNDAETASLDLISLTPTGFKLDSSIAAANENNRTIIYIAIRRPDGYVGKPVELGTDVFAMDTGNGSATIPAFDSGFVVDMRIAKETASSSDWLLLNRLRGQKHLFPNKADDEANTTWGMLDSNVGSDKNFNNTYQAWMWKRHAGMDVVAYKGNSGNPRHIPHQLSKTPEMIWTKNRDQTDSWAVWHNGLTVTPLANAYVLLDTTAAQDTANNHYGSSTPTLPTSTHWTVGNHDRVNNNGENYIAMLFASVDGISKVGYYDGSGSDVTVTTGFQPRFVIIKASNNSRGWTVMDTTRGWGSGVDNKIMLNDTAAQVNTWDYGTPTSTGFTVSHSQYDINYTGWKYIYYAHA